MSDEDETERQLREGAAAAVLLADPAFLLAVERVRLKCSESILTSAPGDTATREENYHLSRALTEITTELLTMISSAETVRISMAEDEPVLPSLFN